MSEVFRKFQNYYYEMASPDTLRLRQPEDLAKAAKSHFELALKRPGDEILVRVRKPAEGALGLACVQTVAPDMPFLVDTLSMALRAAGTSIDWSVHPVLALKRDANGTLTDVAGLGAAAATTKDSFAESLMNFEFDPLTTPGAYEELEKNLRQVLGDLATVVADYQPMRGRVDATAKALLQVKGDVAEEAKEASELMRWLDAEHFTFLGYVECIVENVGGSGVLPLAALPPSMAVACSAC